MNKIVKTSFFLFVLHSSVSNAWTLFSPKDYDDCILQGMKGVTSDIAAAHIAKSCREKFATGKKEASCKAVEFNALEMEEVKTDLEITWVGNYITVAVYNGNRNKTVTELEGRAKQ
ncbi:MAG: hypothetical protein LRY72_17015 [Saccharospirillaceae bacterium]|nr:hypothetical protein [Saccharospirillaceae bacterium]